jgi:hypothetical protein
MSFRPRVPSRMYRLSICTDPCPRTKTEYLPDAMPVLGTSVFSTFRSARFGRVFRTLAIGIHDGH